MPRPDPKAPGPGQDELFDVVQRSKRTVYGRHSAATEKAISARRAIDAVTDADEAALAAIRAAAWALDEFEASGKPYGPAKLLDPLMSALDKLGMTPQSRAAMDQAQDDTLTELLADLGRPAIHDTAQH